MHLWAQGPRLVTMNLMPNYRRASQPVVTDEESKPKGRPSQGPSKPRYLTSGQIRRADAREQATAQRKANKRYRRQWMANQAALARLRGQVAVVDNHLGSPELQANALTGILNKFDTLEDARAHEKKVSA